MRDGVRAACKIRELTYVMGFYFLCRRGDSNVRNASLSSETIPSRPEGIYVVATGSLPRTSPHVACH